MEEDFDIRSARSASEQEKEVEKALRPLTFDDFAGQEKVIENLRIFVEAAKMRGEALDHTLFHGPPGLGKTTLEYHRQRAWSRLQGYIRPCARQARRPRRSSHIARTQ